MVWFHIVIRNSPLTMSAAPAAASAATAHHRLVARPSSAMAVPHAATASTMARPCLLTRAVQPLVMLTSSPPAAGAAYSSPSTAGPPRPAAMAGNSANGAPKNIAEISIRYVPSSSGRLARTGCRRRCCASWGAVLRPGAHRAHEPDGQQRHHGRPGVHGVRGRQAAQCDHPAAEQRPGQGGGVAEQADQPGRGGQVIVPDQDGDQRVLGGALQPVQQRRDGSQREQHPQLVPGGRVDHQDGGDDTARAVSVAPMSRRRLMAPPAPRPARRWPPGAPPR